MTVSRGGGGGLATKINVTFFVGIDVLNIFHLTTFSKKTIFSKIKAKNNLEGGTTIFEGMGCQTNKMNITFLVGKWGTKYSFYFFFSKNPIQADLNPKNWFWGHIFPNICGFIWPIVYKNNKVHPWVDHHQPCEFHENQVKTATCIVTSYV